MDYPFAEWNDKAAGFVGYGSVGGMRAVEHLRLVLGELKVADVRAAVGLTLADDFTRFTDFTPREDQAEKVRAMLDAVLEWAAALQSIRTAHAA